TGKLPSGSVASCREPPQATRPAASSTAIIPIPIQIQLRAFRGPAVEALSSKGAGNIPRTLPPNLSPGIATTGGFVPHTVVGGERRRHHITFLCRACGRDAGPCPTQGGWLRWRAMVRSVADRAFLP